MTFLELGGLMARFAFKESSTSLFPGRLQDEVEEGDIHGSGWESNPPGPLLQHPSDGFEDRGAHRDSTTPMYSHRILAF